MGDTLTSDTHECIVVAATAVANEFFDLRRAVGIVLGVIVRLLRGEKPLRRFERNH